MKEFLFVLELAIVVGLLFLGLLFARDSIKDNFELSSKEMDKLFLYIQ